jgi:hypothetical protein
MKALDLIHLFYTRLVRFLTAFAVLAGCRCMFSETHDEVGAAIPAMPAKCLTIGSKLNPDEDTMLDYCLQLCTRVRLKVHNSDPSRSENPSVMSAFKN